MCARLAARTWLESQLLEMPVVRLRGALLTRHPPNWEKQVKLLDHVRKQHIDLPFVISHLLSCFATTKPRHTCRESLPYLKELLLSGFPCEENKPDGDEIA